ncbi:MAG: hypothetical protein ACMXYK_01605, partial [Candidatus Woesearchaeota archaeon]
MKSITLEKAMRTPCFFTARNQFGQDGVYSSHRTSRAEIRDGVYEELTHLLLAHEDDLVESLSPKLGAKRFSVGKLRETEVMHHLNDSLLRNSQPITQAGPSLMGHAVTEFNQHMDAFVYKRLNASIRFFTPYSFLHKIFNEESVNVHFAVCAKDSPQKPYFFKVGSVLDFKNSTYFLRGGSLKSPFNIYFQKLAMASRKHNSEVIDNLELVDSLKDSDRFFQDYIVVPLSPAFTRH